MSLEDDLINEARDHVHNWCVSPEFEDFINTHEGEVERLVALVIERARKSQQSEIESLRAELQQANDKHKSEVARFHDHIDRNLSGKCICPTGDREAEHYPGCPVRLKAQLQQCRESLDAMSRLRVLAIKHCPKDHHDWQDILRLTKEMEGQEQP